MTKINKINTESIIAILISLFVFIYLIIRAISIPLVHDEAATFFHYIQSGSFIPLQSLNDANNHFLNSLLTYISYSIFGDSPIVLRLANLLSFPIFALFTYKLSGLLNNKFLKWLLFLSLMLSHSFIEYFALTRGYGMSMSFLMAAIYYLLRCIDDNKIKHYSLTLLFATLAVMANLTIIIPLVILSFILIVNYIINSKNKGSLYIPLIIIIQGILPIILFAYILMLFKNDGLLYYGTMDGFWSLSVLSLLKLLTQNTGITIQGFIIIALITISIINIYIVINTLYPKIINNKSLVLSFFLWTSFIAIIILAKLFDINYPEDRTGLYFYPIFILSFIFSLDYIVSKTHKKLYILLATPLLFLPMHFAWNMNISYSSFWKNERIPESFISKIKQTSSDYEYQPTIGGSHIRVLCFAYNNYRAGGELNQVQKSIFPETYSDYQIVNFTEGIDWLKYYNIIDYDEFSELRLLKKRNLSNPKTILKKSSKIDIKTEDEYYNFIKYNLDTLSNKALLVTIEFEITSNASPFAARIILNTEDSNANTINYDYISLNWKQAKWTNDSNIFKGSFIVPKLPKNAKKLSVYLWNINKDEFVISDIQAEIKLLNL